LPSLSRLTVTARCELPSMLVNWNVDPLPPAGE
jgi:hypothetical protein